MTKAEISEAISQHKARNDALARELLHKGVNLGEPRSVDLHFWASTQRDAALLARELYQMGFLILVLSPPDPGSEDPRWNIEAGVTRSASDIMELEFVAKMVRLAAKHSAVFDGWGTSI